MTTWAAEVVVEPRLAADLIAAQFPELSGRTPRLVGAGWDVTVYALDDEWVFRFPRRQVAVPGVELEIAVLPRLAPFLPVAIPVPDFVGRPSERYAWPFFGARFIPGAEAAETEAPRRPLARELGEALRALHAPEVFAALSPELPDNPARRADMQAAAVPRAREWLPRLADVWQPPPLAEHVLEQALELPPPRATAVVHGDLHFRHLLVHGGRLNGLIDWIDVSRADPAVDLQLYWSFFDADERAEFLAAYGRIDDERLLRARVIALFLNGLLASYAREERLPAIEREALAGLSRTVSP